MAWTSHRPLMGQTEFSFFQKARCWNGIGGNTVGLVVGLLTILGEVNKVCSTELYYKVPNFLEMWF